MDAVYASDDSETPYRQYLYEDSSVLSRIDDLTVPTFHLAGWFDSFTRGQLLTFQQALANERRAGRNGAGRGAQGRVGPNYLVIGPWDHSGTHFAHYPELQQRLVDWYGHWLRGDPAPAWFGNDRAQWWLMGEGDLYDDTGEWRTSPTWPPTPSYQRRYLRADGSITLDAPGEGEGTLAYAYDPSYGLSEFPSRWDNAAGVTDTSRNDQAMDGDRPTVLTWTTEELEQPMALAGPITVDLRAATTGVSDPENSAVADVPTDLHGLVPPWHDTDWVVKLSDVAPDGTATLITSGFLRASHRAVDLDESEVVDGQVVRPQHPHTEVAIDPPAAGEVRDYLIEVWPTAKTFLPGHRLRIDLSSADTPNHLSLPRAALNEVSVDAANPSSILLPLVRAGGMGDGDVAGRAPAAIDGPPGQPAAPAASGHLRAWALAAWQALLRLVA